MDKKIFIVKRHVIEYYSIEADSVDEAKRLSLYGDTDAYKIDVVKISVSLDKILNENKNDRRKEGE